MSLYSCQRCGWATTDSWTRAIAAHETCCPDCAGGIELVSYAGNRRSADRGIATGRLIELRRAPTFGGGSAA
jgi:hypothetical protein